MLKTIKKISLISLFAFSSVAPMRQVAQVAVARMLNQSVSFRNSLATRCPSLFLGVSAQESTQIDEVQSFHLNENATMTTFEPANSFIVMDSEGGHYCTATDTPSSDTEFRDQLDQIEKERFSSFNQNAQGRVLDLNQTPEAMNGRFYPAIDNQEFSNFNKIKARDAVQGYVSSHGGSIVPDHQIQSYDDKMNVRIATQDQQSAQHMSEIIGKAQLATIVESVVSDVKATLVKNLENHTTNVRNEVFEIVGSCSSSQHDLESLKAELNQPLPQLKTKFQSLCPANSQIDLIVNSEKYGFKNNIPKNWTKQDLDKAQEALGLKNQIESREAAIQAINCKIKQAEQVEILQEKQEQKTLAFSEQQIANQYDFINSGSQNCPDAVSIDRQDAWLTMLDQDFLQYDQSFNLTPQTCGFLAANGIDYKNFQNFYGTAFQQQLHEEMCNILSQAALLQTKFSHPSKLVNSMVDVADAAHDGNKLGQIKIVVSLNNLGFALLEYGQAVVTGTQLGLKGIAHTVSHLDQAVESVGKALYYVCETLVIGNYHGSNDWCIQFREQRKAEIIEALNNLGHKIQNSTGPERVQALTQFAVEWYGLGNISKVVSGVCGITEFAAVKGASCIESEINASKAVEKTAKVTQERIAKSLVAELTEAKKLAFLNSDYFIVEFKKIGGVISVENKIFKDQFQAVLKQLEQKLKDPMLEQVKKVYGRSIVNNKEILIDLDHICNFELGLKKSNQAEGYILDISGGHLPGVCEALEKEGLIKIISKHELSAGGVHYVMENASTGKPIVKTVFPEKWTIDKVAQAVLDVYQNDAAVSICENGNFTKSGIVDGCELKIYWESSNNNGKIIEKIVTCLPIKK